MRQNSRESAPISTANLQMPAAPDEHGELHELLTLRMLPPCESPQLGYEHTRSRGTARTSACHTSRSANTSASIRSHARVPAAASRRSREPPLAVTTMEIELRRHEEPTREKECSRMARRKRQYGSGSLFKEGRGWAIRWRELELLPTARSRSDCVTKHRDCFRAEAVEILRRKVAESGSSEGPTRSRVSFRTLTQQWEVDVLPTKSSTRPRKNHRHIMEKHLIPRLGDLAPLRRHHPTIQSYVTHLTKAGMHRNDRSHP